MRLLVTGGCGFIGSNFIRNVMAAHSDWSITNLDLLTYAGNLENLASLKDNPAYNFVKGDICDAVLLDSLFSQKPDAVLHFAAETHVDRSIHGGANFVRTNVSGSFCLLEAARRHKIGRFLQISTDEVYGSLGAEGRFTEDSPIKPNSPYSASKASADLLARSFFKTYGTPVLITRCSNNYGPYQFPEKLIPLFIVNLLEGKKVPLYGDGLNIRDWIHADDHSRAIEAVLLKGREGQVYNIGSDNEKSNKEITYLLLKLLGKNKSSIEFVPDRPGHDRRYAIDSAKIQSELGWHAKVSFEQGMKETVAWYKSNKSWWEKIRSGEYLTYYEKQYGKPA